MHYSMTSLETADPTYCHRCGDPLELIGYRESSGSMICGSCYAERMGYFHV